MAAASDIQVYETKLMEMRERLIPILGRFTVDVLMQRSVSEVSQTYPEMSLIRVTGDALFFGELERHYADESEERPRSAFSALYAVMIIVLARTLGKEIAFRLVDSPDARLVMEGKSIGTN